MKNVMTTLFALLAAAACVSACSTDTVSTPRKGDASTSGVGGGGAGGDNTAGDNTVPTDDSGLGGSAGGGGVVEGGPVACVKVPADGMITDFSTPCPADGSAIGQACFGTYDKTVFGGTWAAFPVPGGGPDAGPDTDQEAGAACTSFPSKSTFAASTSTGAWVFSGTVSTWSGAGIWLAPCVNASAFSGLQFTVSGDAGTTGQMSVTGFQLSNWANAAVGGTCSGTCSGATATFPVTATPTPQKLPWASFTGGMPSDSIDDPSKLIQFQWQLDWPCTDGVPYDANVTIDDLKFYK